jgi:nucleoside-diphosphate-sugar epimerase
VAGSARSAEGAAAITAQGWQGLVLDGDRRSADLSAAVAAATHVLVSAPPGDAGDPILRALGGELQRAPRLAWIGYLSTVGVYGDHGGGWVDETTPAVAPGARGGRRLEAEAAWLSFGETHAKCVEVFRLPGIYGPGRSAIDQLLAGTARRIVKPGQVFNRIHVEDLATALEAAITQPPRHSVYNLADDEPAPADEVVAYAAGLLGMAPPPAIPIESAQLSPMAASFYEQSKRVSNRRMKEALGVRLAYPTYREGLAAIAAQREPGKRRPT